MLKRKDQDGDEAAIVLKALIDINLPKFLKQDIPLFNNIISDLFPSTNQPNYSLGGLEESITIVLEENNWFISKEFYEKIKQLYDTLQVRHGIMMVGPTGSGKTTNYKCLQAAINRIAVGPEASDEDRENNPYRKVITRIVNPKAILNEQIYGQMNQITKE
jgi:dynein heavy chain